MIPNTIVAHMRLNVSSKLDTDEGEGLRGWFKFAMKQLDAKIHFIDMFLEDRYGDLPSVLTLNPGNQSRNSTPYPSKAGDD